MEILLNSLPLELLLLLCFTIIAFQDLRDREIHIFPLIGILCIGSYQAYMMPFSAISICVKTLLFITFSLGGTYGYLAFKHKAWINPLKNYMGLGDILFFIAIVPLFNFQNYMLFFISGLLFSVLTYLIFKTFRPKVTTIPLAGLLSIYFFCVKLLSKVFNFNFLTDSLPL